MATSEARPEFVAARFRATRACYGCRQKRVKCDAMDQGTPCSRCVASGHTNCLLFESKRGTYKRRKKTTSPVQPVIHGPHLSDPDVQQTFQQPTTSNALKAGSTEEVRRQPVSPQPTSHGSRFSSEVLARHEDRGQAELPSAPLVGGRSVAEAVAMYSVAVGGPGNVTEDSTGEASEPQNQPTSLDCSSPADSCTTLSPYPDISWASTFDPFLKTRTTPGFADRANRFSITHLDESFPLSLVLQNQGEGKKPQLHYLSPANPEPSAHRQCSGEGQHPAHIPTEDIKFLHARGCFTLPDPDVLDFLVKTFLDRVYPLYPIFTSRGSFLKPYRTQQIPWLLFHSVCFAAVTFADEDALFRAGYKDRMEARLLFYRKAKALFDMGYHMNKIMVLQSVILLSFWGSVHNNYWNSASWIGTGVIIAESLGIHRSMKETKLAPEDKSLLRRLWWVLFVRDTGAATFSGRQFRMNTVDVADVEMLSPEDFVTDARDDEGEEEAGEGSVHYPLDSSFGLFHVENTKLAVILRRIVLSKRTGHGPNHDQLCHELQQWRNDLPPEVAWGENCGTTKPGLLPTCLALSYNHNLILANLSSRHFLQPASSVRPDYPSVRSLDTACENAAHQILDLACAMATKSTFSRLPHEAFHALFLAEAVFYSQVLSPTDPVGAKMGRMAVTTCQVVWHGVRRAWDPARWAMKLFENLLDAAARQRQSSDDAQQMLVSNTSNAQESSLLDVPMNDFGGMDLVFSSMFDMSTGMDGMTGDSSQMMFSFDLTDEAQW
ncbi:uncharacterized protein Z520_00891 [Fonsecaea multimorphosa CBS 102226]|uniref:Zn(2)-C6 fungal-type domain-containing protein n=1 Tax=Fonsecaea multimorphosa CBS 102226 TaxID=1442371 RepID=A0A0D2KDK9_9EURO|nr:uncharacterized protein Z520_00891 [Fonsecaea multimorphosa CBS 102226]KIY04198.1 hypothetical protein Z520_00891 [Fonsecaea multimorphosa CBS 102226]OAL32027.1 hypothetical protein AYO22_00897 [Fonsecaea multimorphosa]